MPEGHTIHRLARDQRRDLAGRPVTTATVQPRFAAGAARLHGHVPERFDAWGKHQFTWFDTGDVLHVHLGLIGKWRRHPSPAPDPVGQVRLRLEGDERAWDLSGAMVCRLIGPDEVDEVVAPLGPDPLRRDADPERMWDRLQRSTRPVGQLLLDQSVVAGIGNVYRAELLFLVGVHPGRRGRDLSRDEFDRLWAETVHQLRLGVRRNRIVTRPPDELPATVGRVAREDALFAYHQEHCRRCGSAIEVLPMGGRNIWACPVCQPR